MRKKQATKTVEFANLPEDHKAQFIQFLIKNNICFQEGKEDCTARVSLKQAKTSQAHSDLSQSHQPRSNKINIKKERQSMNKQSNIPKKEKTIGKKLHIRNDIMNRQNGSQILNKQLVTPKKNVEKQLKGSSLSCKGKQNTANILKNQTPRSTIKGRSLKPQSLRKIRNSSSKKIIEQKSIHKNQTQKLEVSHQKQNINIFKTRAKPQYSRQKVVSKYAKLFQLCQKGRPIRWPLNLLERSIQQIYDDIFMRNTQCLQNKNISNALKTLTQTSFPQLIQAHFRKKYKGSKLAATNLNNMLYTLSSSVSKEGCSIFVKNFEEFILSQWQHQDLMYYLFARNVLKKQLRISQKNRDLNKIQGCYFTETIKAKEIMKCLYGIIGRDPQLLSEYKQLITTNLGAENFQAYQLLRILLQDYHCKRIGNKINFQTESLGPTLFQKDQSYQNRNNTEQLTFGQEHEDQKQAFMQRCSNFWICQEYSRLKDSLFDLIMQKMAQKVIQLLQLLGNDIQAPPEFIQTLEQILFKKAESMVKAVFQMNKMKWFKELALTNPSEQDMNAIELIQMRFRQLRSNPSGRQIGQFCKNILTTKALVNELQLTLMISD